MSCANNFKRSFKHAEAVCKIDPKVLTQEQKQHVACCQDWTENEEGSNFLQRVITGGESWIYKYDLEKKGRVKSGSTVVRLATRKHTRVIQKSRSCSLFFLYSRSVITNLFHRVKQLMPHFMWKFWNVWVNVCDMYDPKCGQKRTGSCTMTMHLCTRRLLCMSFFAKNDLITMDHSSYLPDLNPWLFFVP
jgi:hypothetical protein